MKRILLFIFISIFSVYFFGNSKAQETSLINFEKKKFPKSSIGSIVKLKKIRKNCLNDSLTFWGYSKCIDRHRKLNFLGNPYADKEVLNNLRRVLLINLRLNKLNIISDQKALDNFENFIFSENSKDKIINNADKIQEFINCNYDKKFITFITCFEKNFRSWQSYKNTDIRNKVILEEIVGYSLILLHKKRINSEIIFESNQDIDNVTFYRGKNYLANITLKNEDGKTYYLSNDNDGFIFLEKLINFYTSIEYNKKLNTEFESANVSQDYFIKKYENRNFWEKVDDFFEKQDNQQAIKIAETALSIYLAYDLVNSLNNGNLFKGDDLIGSNKKNFNRNNNSNFNRGVIISPNGSWQPGMFKFTPRGNVLRQRWTPLVLFRGGFF